KWLEPALGFHALRPRAADVAVCPERAIFADSGSLPETAPDADHVVRVAAEQRQIETEPVAVAIAGPHAEVQAATALRLELRIAEVGEQLEQARRLDPLAIARVDAPPTAELQSCVGAQAPLSAEVAVVVAAQAQVGGESIVPVADLRIGRARRGML